MVPITLRLQKSTGWDWQNLQELALDMGYKYIHQRGSHKKFRHEATRETVIIPMNKDLRRTSSSIVSRLRATWEKLHPVPQIEPPTPIEETPEMPAELSWRDRIRITRENAHLTMRQVGEAMGLEGNPAVQFVFELEKRGRKFTPEDFPRWCSVFKLNPDLQTWMTDFETRQFFLEQRRTLFGIPTNKGIQQPIQWETTPESEIQQDEPEQEPVLVQAPQEEATVPFEISDILAAGELAMSRFRELDTMMREAEKFRPEYERLRDWLQQGGNILGL